MHNLYFFSSVNSPEKVLYINGIMRTVLTPAADKMIISTQGGYFIIIHNLNIDHLRADMDGYVINKYITSCKTPHLIC